MRVSGFVTRITKLEAREGQETGLGIVEIEGLSILSDPCFIDEGSLSIGAEVTVHVNVRWKKKDGVTVPQFWLMGVQPSLNGSR